MLRSVLIGLSLLLVIQTLQADSTKQPALDASKAWFKPTLIENNDDACNDLLEDAQRKYFSNIDFGAAYGISGEGYAQNGTILDWTVLGGTTSPNTVEAYGKIFYLSYKNNKGCGGACESNQPLASEKPFPENRDDSYLEQLAVNAPPPASYNWLIAQKNQNPPFLFIVGEYDAYKDKLLIYKLTPEGQWKSACKISLAPPDIYKINDEDISSATKSIQDLNNTLLRLSRGAGSCGTMGTHYRWQTQVKEELEKTLFKPVTTKNDSMYGGNSYGHYEITLENLEKWALTGTSEYTAFSNYKKQLTTTINDVSKFYQKKYGWPAKQSDDMAENALTSAISKGFGFYMFDPQFATGEAMLRKAILEKKSLDEIKAIPFDTKKLDSQITEWVGGEESRESILNITIDYPDALKFLLEKGVNPESQNAFGKTPLMYAAQYNQIESAKLLIDHGANTVSATLRPENTCYYKLKTYGMTPLHYAARYASPDFIKLLLDNDAAVFMKTESFQNASMTEDSPLDWLHRYTGTEASERNSNIPNERVAEIETWLKIPDPNQLKKSAQYYITEAEKKYQEGKTNQAYSSIIRALDIQPDNEKALSDMSLIALKNGALGASLEASEKILQQSTNNKIKANAWFNQGLACEKFQSYSKRSSFPYNGKYYCQNSIIYSYLNAWSSEKSSSRAKKIISLFEKNQINYCEKKVTNEENYKLHFAFAENKQKIYVFHPEKYTADQLKIHWGISVWSGDPKTKPAGVFPTRSTTYDFGEYAIDEFESTEMINFPVIVGESLCRSDSSKDYAVASSHTELHAIGIYEPPHNGIVEINLNPNKNPVILFLTAYEKTKWIIKNNGNVNIARIILGGFHDQFISTPDSSIPIEKRIETVAPCMPNCYGSYYFFSNKTTPEDLEKVTGLLPASFQYRYQEAKFMVPPLK